MARGDVEELQDRAESQQAKSAIGGAENLLTSLKIQLKQVEEQLKKKGGPTWI